MFNDYTVNNTVENNIDNSHPAENGILRISNNKSFFVRFDKHSKLEEAILCEDPHLIKPTSSGGFMRTTSVTVLQLMLVGGKTFVCELVERNDNK